MPWIVFYDEERCGSSNIDPWIQNYTLKDRIIRPLFWLYRNEREQDLKEMYPTSKMHSKLSSSQEAN